MGLDEIFLVTLKVAIDDVNITLIFLVLLLLNFIDCKNYYL